MSFTTRVFSFYSMRLCYRVLVKKCSSEDDIYSNYYGCRLIAGKRKNWGFTLDNLYTTGGNQSSVFIDSLNRTETRTVCFYNVSVSDDEATENCSVVSLQHKVNHPPSKYVDRIAQSDSNSSTNTTRSCKSYVRVYYDNSQGVQQYETFCREELATLDRRFPAKSLFIVYWSNNDLENNRNSSFHLRAQCAA